MSDTDSTFPSITFPATFEGAAAIGADFNTCLKFKPADALKVLSDLKALPRGTYDVTVVARQAQLAGDSVDREWAEMTLIDGDASELIYERTCLGARCPVFAVHSSGEFEGRYVCEDAADAETYMEVVHGETRCPRFAASDADDDAVDELPIEAEGEVTYSPDTLTVKELAEEFGALVVAAGDVDDMNEADAARYNVLSDELTARGRNPQDWRRIAEDDAA